MTFDQKLQFWNTLGTWIAGAGTLLAVIVSLRLALRAENLQRKADQRRNSAELYALFASADLERARADAAAFLRENNSKQSPLTFQEIHSNCTTATLTSVTRVIQFWEQTAVFIDAEYVDDELTQKFLRHFFRSHYENYLAEFINVCKSRPDDSAYLHWTAVLEGLAQKWQIFGP